MRTALLLTTSLLLAACDKPGTPPAQAPVPPEKKPALATPAQSPSRPAAAPAAGTPPSQPPPPPPTREEVDALYAAMNAWLKDAEPLLAQGAPPPDYKQLHMKFMDLLKLRTKVTAGMTKEQEKEVFDKFGPAQKQFSEIQRRRLNQSLQKIPRPPGVPAVKNPPAPPAEGSPPPAAGVPAPPP